MKNHDWQPRSGDDCHLMSLIQPHFSAHIDVETAFHALFTSCKQPLPHCHKRIVVANVDTVTSLVWSKESIGQGCKQKHVTRDVQLKGLHATKNNFAKKWAMRCGGIQSEMKVGIILHCEA